MCKNELLERLSEELGEDRAKKVYQEIESNLDQAEKVAQKYQDQNTVSPEKYFAKATI